MKFAFVAPRFHTNMYYRVLSLQQKGHDVKVYVLYKGQSEFYEDIDLITLNLSLFSKLLLKIFGIQKKNNKLKSHYEVIIQSPGKSLKKEFRKYKPEIVFLKEFKNLLALRTLFAAKGINAKVIIFSQSQTATIKGSQKLFKYLMSFFRMFGVKAFITPVKQTFYNFSNNNPLKIFYIPFVHPIKKRIVITSKNHVPIKILSIGKYVKRKDHFLLIKAVENLLSKRQEYILNIFGEIGDQDLYNFLQSYIYNNNLNKNIHLHTNIPYKKIMNEYVKHDVFILPSYKEPAAYSPVEAIAHGLPVICSSECGTKCYIENGINGFIFKAHDQKDLENKIELLYNDPQKLTQLSINALKKAADIHDVPRFAENVEKILKII